MSKIKTRLLMTQDDIDRANQRMAQQVWERHENGNLALVGVLSRGATLAKRLKSLIETIAQRDIPLGILDIAFYRDDIGMTTVVPEVRSTDIPFDVEGKDILLIDDVLYTGRTIRAALNALMDLGRPRRVELLVLIDRKGLRELPIQANYIGKEIRSSATEKVSVKFMENDGQDEVTIDLE